MFNIWVYVLAFFLGIIIGYAINLIIKNEVKIKQYEQKEKDGLIYIEPKPTRSDRYAEFEWKSPQ